MHFSNAQFYVEKNTDFLKTDNFLEHIQITHSSSGQSFCNMITSIQININVYCSGVWRCLRQGWEKCYDRAQDNIKAGPKMASRLSLPKKMNKIMLSLTLICLPAKIRNVNKYPALTIQHPVQNFHYKIVISHFLWQDKATVVPVCSFRIWKREGCRCLSRPYAVRKYGYTVNIWNALGTALPYQQLNSAGFPIKRTATSG